MAIIENGPRFTPADLEAAFDRLSDLYDEYHKAEDHATHCPKSEQDDARVVADEAKDECLQYISHLLAGAK